MGRLKWARRKLSQPISRGSWSLGQAGWSGFNVLSCREPGRREAKYQRQWSQGVSRPGKERRPFLVTE